MTIPLTDVLSKNLYEVRERMSAACARVGRALDEVTLIAVTKYAALDWVRGLIELGVTDLGESRPQQLVARAEQLPAHVRWHQIGHLQRNKADILLPVVDRIHSVDSLRLIEHLAKSAIKLGRIPRILLEVNVSGESSKDGFIVDELLAAWPQILEHGSLAIDGLMTMAPLADDPETARSVFRGLRELRDRLREASGGRCQLPELSMGMSGDFEIGIEEGATLIRVGSRLFEGLYLTRP
jgi:PLP dependent protein